MNSRRHSYLLTFGHASADINQGSLPAMLPFLILSYDLSYTAAAALVFANSFVSAIVQPLFGYIGDKINRPGLMSLGILLASAGIAAMGFASSYWQLFFCAIVMGIGVALFHPEGAKLANIAAGKNKGAGLSNYSVGGNIGFALGPILIVFTLTTFGMRGTILYLFLGIIFSLILLSQSDSFRKLTSIEAERIKNSDSPVLKDDWVGFTKSSLVSVMRSVLSTGMHTFIPLYLIAVLGQSQEYGALMLTLYSAGGAIATLIGGRIADRVGLKQVGVLSIGSVGPLLIIFLLTNHAIPAAMVFLLCGLVHGLGHAPMVALGQSYLPNRLGFASGISMGVAISMGGMIAPGLGVIGDIWGLRATITSICVLAFIGLGLGSLLFIGRNARDGIGAPTKGKGKKA